MFQSATPGSLWCSSSHQHLPGILCLSPIFLRLDQQLCVTIYLQVMWTTNSSLYAPTVQFGSNADSLSSSANGTTSTYFADSMCGPGANESEFEDVEEGETFITFIYYEKQWWGEEDSALYSKFCVWCVMHEWAQRLENWELGSSLFAGFQCFGLFLLRWLTPSTSLVDFSLVHSIMIAVMLMDTSTLASYTKFFWLVWPFTLFIVVVVFSLLFSRSCLPNNILLPGLILCLLFMCLLRRKKEEWQGDRGIAVFQIWKMKTLEHHTLGIRLVCFGRSLAMQWRGGRMCIPSPVQKPLAPIRLWRSLPLEVIRRQNLWKSYFANWNCRSFFIHFILKLMLILVNCYRRMMVDSPFLWWIVKVDEDKGSYDKLAPNDINVWGF